MQVIEGNMFKKCKDGDSLCVTTNGEINKYGNLIMGKGIARDFRDNFDGIDKRLGKYVKKYGNRVFKIGKTTIEIENQSTKTVTLFSFPTKYNWRDKSDLNLIEQSCIQLKEIIEKYNIQGDVYIPAPGCANGGLNWEDQVKPIVERYFGEDRYIICFKEEVQQ